MVRSNPDMDMLGQDAAPMTLSLMTTQETGTGATLAHLGEQ